MSLGGFAAYFAVDHRAGLEQTLHDVIQSDGTKANHKANPGWSTRSMAMMKRRFTTSSKRSTARISRSVYAEDKPAGRRCRRGRESQAAYRVLSDIATPNASCRRRMRLQAIAINAWPRLQTAPRRLRASRWASLSPPACNDQPRQPQRRLRLDAVGSLCHWSTATGNGGRSLAKEAGAPDWGSVKPFGVPSATLKGYIDDAFPICRH